MVYATYELTNKLLKNKLRTFRNLIMNINTFSTRVLNEVIIIIILLGVKIKCH